VGGKRENIGPELRDQRPFTKKWSKKLYKILYSIIGYFYENFVSFFFSTK